MLLSLLLARGHALPREVLVDRLWPKGDLESGVAGLHNALSSLRAALGGGPTARLAVVSRGEIVALSPSL